MRLPNPASLTQRLLSFGQVEQSPLREGNRTVLYPSSGALLEASRELIRTAKRTIEIEMYIWACDDVGRGFCELLAESVTRGLQVRVLYDAVGCWEESAHLTALAAHGATVVPFRPIAPWRMRGNINHRNHRKLIIVDDTVAIVGGANWGADYDSFRFPEAFLDVGFGVSGPVVADLAQDFRRVWAMESDEPIPAAQAPRSAFDPPGEAFADVPVQMLSGVARGDRSSIRRLYSLLIRSAASELFVANSYFVPGRRLVRHLSRAARRGLDVTLLLPGHTDMKWVQMAGRATYEPLLAAGVRIFERKDRMYHGKAAIVDGQVAVVGSSNLDPRSFRYNLELNLNASHPALATALRSVLEAELALSERIELATFRRRPWTQKLWSRVAYVFRSLL
ncbi:MAG: phosphatidylserine/phosphatidylglycerophosphate/cardiolipin synthase family protein [Thermoanaerobaculia bacterium]